MELCGGIFDYSRFVRELIAEDEFCKKEDCRKECGEEHQEKQLNDLLEVFRLPDAQILRLCFVLLSYRGIDRLLSVDFDVDGLWKQSCWNENIESALFYVAQNVSEVCSDGVAQHFCSGGPPAEGDRREQRSSQLSGVQQRERRDGRRESQSLWKEPVALRREQQQTRCDRQLGQQTSTKQNIMFTRLLLPSCHLVPDCCFN